ncbi:MAG: peptide ABC transporter substrate-binding protein, partial [Silicimonas sp.]|nr:peptide ABC transporter substrate-binding protein [Silicimonas sp.]
MDKRKETYLARQARRLTTGEINRRRFVMSALATGVTLPTAMSLAGRAEAMTPKSGGTFRQALGHGSTTDSLDPATAENDFSTTVIYSRGNHLTEVSNTGELVGDLSESFESADAKTWVFNLRPGVEFHNGKTLTPEDVIASINYHRAEDSKSAAKGLVTQVADIRKDGDNQVIIELEGANADFPYIMSDYHLMIQASADGAIDAQAADNGTGGYMVEVFEPGVRATFTRNP